MSCENCTTTVPLPTTYQGGYYYPPRPRNHQPEHRRRPRLLTRLRRYKPVDVQFRALFDDPETTRSAA